MYKKIRYISLFVLLVVVLAVFFRIVRLNELFHFTYDESVFAFVGKRIFINRHIPLIGGVTPFHVHVGPYFYWFSSVLLYFSNLYPSGWGIFSAVFSGITIFLLYTYCKEVYSHRVAFIASLIYSFSLYINIFERHYWGLYFNPAISIVVFYCLIKIIKGKNRFFLLLGITLAFAFHNDLTTLVFFPLVIWTFIKYKINIINNRHALIGLLIFLLSFVPLIIFDLKHDFVNIKGVGQYFSEAKKSTGFSLKRTIDSFYYLPLYFARIIYIPQNLDLAKEYSYCKEYAAEKWNNVPITLVVITLVVIFYNLFFERFKKGQELLKTFVFSIIIGVIIYFGFLGRPFFDHYLSTLIPVAVIFIAQVINKIIDKSRVLGYSLIVLFLILNLLKFTRIKHSYGFDLKSQAIKWAIENTEKDFSLESLSSCFRYNGYRYLFYLYGKEPKKSYVDQNFFWLFDEFPSEDHPNLLVVMVADDFKKEENLISKYKLYKEREIKSRKFGNLEVIIADNTKGIFYDF